MKRLVVSCALAAGCGFSAPGSPAGPTPADAADPQQDARAIDAAIVDAAMIDAAIDAPPPPPPAPVTVMLPITADTYVDALAANTNFGASQSFLVDGGGTPATSLLRVDVSSIPTSATVTVAVLHIWTSNDLGATTSVFKMLEAWDENTATVGQRMSGVAWSAMGAAPPSRDTTALGTIAPTTSFTEKTVLALQGLVQGWVTTPASNFGFAIASSLSDGSTYRSREDATTSRRPYFEITYQP